MGLNLGLFLQIGQYTSANFGTGRSGGFTGPDAPENGYADRIFSDGENTGEGAALCG
jgi:hypothetical protein